MDINSKIIITDIYGNDIECDVLFTFDSNETGKSYIIYTDNTKDEYGNLKVYANIYNPNRNSGVFEKIESEKEFEIIEQIFDSIKNEKE